MTFYFIPKDRFDLFLVVNVIGFLCMGPTSALTWALYGDVADYGEWKFGRRSTGLVFSASLFAIKTGNLVGGFLLALFLASFSYRERCRANPQGLARYHARLLTRARIYRVAQSRRAHDLSA